MSKSYEKQLLENWEDIFRQGLLTFWVFVAIENTPLSVSEIKLRVYELTRGSYDAAEQTLYRLLRKQYDLETVDYTEVHSEQGPKRKLYSLSSTGKQLLREFSNRNIGLFFQDEVVKMIKEIPS